jgi:hypothetical protein
VQEGQNPGVTSLRHQGALLAVWCHQQFLLHQINNEETDIIDHENDGKKRCETAFLEELRHCYCSFIQVFFLQTLEVMHEN